MGSAELISPTSIIVVDMKLLAMKVDSSGSGPRETLDMGGAPLSVEMYACGVDRNIPAVRDERGPMSLGAVPLMVSTIKLAVDIHCCAVAVL